MRVLHGCGLTYPVEDHYLISFAKKIFFNKNPADIGLSLHRSLFVSQN